MYIYIRAYVFVPPLFYLTEGKISEAIDKLNKEKDEVEEDILKAYFLKRIDLYKCLSESLNVHEYK